jgi:SAM-dependent methyltransferase
MTRTSNDWYDDSGMARAYEEHASESPYNTHYDRPAALELLGDVRGQRVLDAACGPGLYAAELVARGAELAAFDLSECMLDLARQRVGDAVSLSVASLGDRLPYEDETFDRVLCALAIHYADDRGAAFAEFYRVLRSGGAAVVSTHHPTANWLRDGGSYFDVTIATDTFELDGRHGQIQFWREPLGSLCDAATSAGFLIERVVEPRPTDIVRARWPDTYEKLERQPAFMLLRLVKP